MKRSLALILALVMLIGMMPMQAFATEEAEVNPWSGRSAVFVGDSITAGTGTTKTYYQFLEETLGFGSVTAMGVAGSCVSASSDYGQSNQPLINRYQSIPSADLIMVFMGTNDYGHETPLGSVEDTQDGTFYGALNTIIPALVAKHTSSKIVFVTPLHRYGFGTSKILGTQFTYDHIPNGVGATLGDYVDALKTVCANNGVSVIDLHTEYTLDPADADVRTNYMPDGLHPNAAGHEVIAGIMESHIRGYEPVEGEPVVQTELIHGNKFAAGNNQSCRASSRINYYLKAGTVITLNNPDVMQWACAKTSDENSSSNLGYFPDSGWSDKETAVVAADGWVGFTFKYRDETQSFDLTKPLSDYITIEEPHTHTYENGICTGCGEAAPTLAGKTISILGASISTYTGISNNPDYNSTIGNNAVYYTEGKLGVYKNDTWWMQAANDLDLRLLVNNSWSGSSLLYERNGTVGAYVDRCVQLHNNEGETPDIIAIQMGTNDFQYYKDTLGTADIDYAALIVLNADGSYTYAEPTTSLEAAAIVLHKISIRYPNAEVYYLNISQRIDGTDELIRSFNAELKQVVEHFGAHIVDIYGSAITMADFDAYIGDGRVHPNCLGMDAYTEAFKRALLANTAYEVDTHTVSLDLDDVTADYGDDKIVVSGDAFSCKLTAEDGKELSVSVTMGGEDITDTAYENGTVSIESVTDDVVIAAEATVHQSQNYRWEFDGTDLACVSGGNTLSKNSGTITDGVFSKTSYTLENEVVLMHDLPWIVEWKCEGTFLNTNGSSGARIFTSDNVNANYNARYIFKSNTNGIIAMGEKDTNGSHNYGIALADHGIDWTELHTYRLENRIAADGSNMIYLLVDGKEIGPMNHYYIGTKDQNTTTDWLSGKDFVFPYMGTDTHGFTNASIDYIQVWEGCHTHTYENGTCTACDAEHPNLANYEGKVISILGGSTCTFDGYIPVADGFNLTHRPRYPQDNLLTDANDTWWMQVVAELGAKLGINDSWAGSQVLNTLDSNSGDLGPDAAMASLTRIQNLGANGTPDIILFYGAMNDIGRGVALGSFDAGTAPSQADLTATKWSNLADAYVAAILRMQHYYPNAEIVAMLPGPTASYYTEAERKAYCEVLKAICDHYGVPTVDLSTCGLTTDDMPDGTHPNAAGMDYITAAVLDTLLNECQMEAGENMVHSVTHELSGSKSSLGYYKGVSDGKSFVTTITGEDVTVTVTMGGVDITDRVYTDGKVSISAVTGDIVITAKGKYNADGRLQQLPENYCCNTNLWTILDPVNEYYTTSGWGNNSNSNYSVTFPVTPGDQIWATSFGAAGTNGYSANAVRITWFGENGVLKSLGRDVVYAEFAKNGHITVPEGATAVNIPMASNADTWEIYILNRDHIYENGICTGCGATVSPYLQQLPENIIGCTNLYDSLVPVKGYYTATKYDTSNGNVLSVVIPVEPGDRIAASSFGPVSENMGSVNGIRVTYLLGNEIVSSLSPDDVYSGYTTNGYITVPDGVDAVCVPWWKPSDSNWLTLSQSSKNFAVHIPKTVSAQAPTCTESGYTAGEICEICNASLGEREEIPATGHSYSGDTCTVCGTVNLLAFLDGKYVSILGDSISTFNGYSNNAAVNTTIGANGSRYDAGTADTKPGSYCLLESVDDTWWMHFANRSGMKLLVNNSWAGSQVFGGQTSDGRVIPAAYLDRCVNLHDNTLENNPGNTPINPDVIFVYLGINDYNFNRSKVGTGAVDYGGLVNSDGTYVTPETFGEAYGIMLHKMCNAYPDAQIFAMTLLPENLYSVDKTAWEQHNTYIRGAAEYYGIPVVDLAENCAITWENYSGYMIDKIHPTTAGMKLISDCIEAELVAYYTDDQSHTHTYENGICTACGAAQPGPVITQQPVDGEAKMGERYMVEVLAEGEGLTYQWYGRNAGSKSWFKSSVKDNTYDDVMTEARAGREVYCVITDANGNSVTTDTVKLICIPSEKLEIVTQPTDGEAVLGERFCVTVEATGEGLKYQWYFRNKGATNWSKSSVTDNTYDDIMNNTRAGREVYCVITDRFGNKVTTDTVKLVRVPMKLEITSQPTDAEAAFGEMFCATVEAKGEGLKYQWYYRNAGSEEWHKSGVRDNTYDDEMTKARAGREIYCVITDQWGNTITTDTVKLIAVPEVELKLLEVSYESAAMGGQFCVTVEAEGDGLTYQWYFRNAGATRWSKSGVTDNTYDDVMNKTRANREVYCVITDACGNQITTEVITLTVEK